MTEHNDEADVDRERDVEQALAESQRLEREERNADLARQHAADERMVQALSQD